MRLTTCLKIRLIILDRINRRVLIVMVTFYIINRLPQLVHTQLYDHLKKYNLISIFCLKKQVCPAEERCQPLRSVELINTRPTNRLQIY